MERKVKRYTLEFRQQVRDFAMQNPTLTVAQIARDFDIPEATLHGWMRGKGFTKTIGTASEVNVSQELIEARKRIKELEQENIILKRAAAYFAGEMRPK